MKKLFWIISSLAWLSCLIILIYALVYASPDSGIYHIRLTIGIAFMCVTGVIRLFYRKLYR